MANDAALALALEGMKEIVPYAVSSKSGCDYDGSKFTIPFLNRVYVVHYPEIKIVEEGRPGPVAQYLEIILLHYLLQSDGTPVAGEWIAYRQLPGSALFQARFQQLVVSPLLQAFGDDAEALRQAGEALGGVPMTRTGDVAFRFMVLPRIPLGCVYFQGEEGIPSSVNILFDASAPNYLPTEDLTLLGVSLVSGLKKAKQAKQA